ncbi:MAG: hypothetical protein NTY88_02700 [Bacteroidetes bacterium]|nr:hypothetical protein [Bacteroidota bacterium]
MKNNKTILCSAIVIALLMAALFSGCKKTDSPVAAIVIEGLGFNTTSDAYFSTDGSMTKAVSEAEAMPIAAKIDFHYIFYFSDDEPGFIDPVACLQHWYWDDYYTAWSSTCAETRFYTTTLTKAQFDAAKTDQSKIGEYLNDAANGTLAPHAIFPAGSCIGGRVSSSPASVTLAKGKIFGFKNTTTGKRGLLYIRTDQGSYWPVPVTGNGTRVDIIREK